MHQKLEVPYIKNESDIHVDLHDELSLDGNPEIVPMSIVDFYHLLINFADRYETKEVPEKVEQENLLKISFAAAYAQYLADGQFGANDIYSPLYQSWRIAGNLSFNASASLNAPNGISREKIETYMVENGPNRNSGIKLTDNSESVGAVYMDIMMSIKNSLGTEIFDQDDSGKILQVLGELGVGNMVDVINISMHSMTVNSLTDNLLSFRGEDDADPSKLPYENCFTVSDGISYLYENYPQDEIAVSVMEIFFPVIFAMESTGNGWRQFIDDLENFCTANPTLYRTLPELNDIIECLSVGAAAMEFWNADFEEIYLTVDRTEFEFYNWKQEITFPIQIKSNTDWKLGPKLSFTIPGLISPDKTEGTGDEVVNIKLKSATITGEPEYGMAWPLNFHIYYEKSPGINDTVFINITRYYEGPDKVFELNRYGNTLYPHAAFFQMWATSNCQWMPGEMSSWITGEPGGQITTPQPPASNREMRYYYEANDTGEERVGFFEMKYKHEWESQWSIETYTVVQPPMWPPSFAKVIDLGSTFHFPHDEEYYYGYDEFNFRFAYDGPENLTTSDVSSRLTNAFSGTGVNLSFTWEEPANPTPGRYIVPGRVTLTGKSSERMIMIASIPTQYYGSYLTLYYDRPKP